MGQVNQVIVSRTDFGQGHHAVSHAEQFQDSEVLLGLGLPTLGGCHHEQAGVDCPHPGQHVFDESDVARHIDQ